MEFKSLDYLSNYSFADLTLEGDGLEKWTKTKEFMDLSEDLTQFPEKSLIGHLGRAVLFGLCRKLSPSKVCEIGTFYAGTAELMARALYLNGHGLVLTVDGYSYGRVDPVLNSWPDELRKFVRFFPVSSSNFFWEGMNIQAQYDIVFIDGNHDYEFAYFDLQCAASLIKPGGVVILDNCNLIGPRFAALKFMQDHKSWRELGHGLEACRPDAPFSWTPSVAQTAFFILQAPHGLEIGSVPWTSRPVKVDQPGCAGIRLDLAKPAEGKVHVQIVMRALSSDGMYRKEEMMGMQEIIQDGVIAIDQSMTGFEFLLDQPARCTPIDGLDMNYILEVILAWQPSQGEAPLEIRLPPTPILID